MRVKLGRKNRAKVRPRAELIVEITSMIAKTAI